MTREEAIKELQSYAEHSWGDLNDAFEMAISALRQQETVTDSHQMTNADRIRDMSDEELAWELMLWRCEAVARHHGISSVYPDTQKTILEWLQQPAGEEDKHEP